MLTFIVDHYLLIVMKLFLMLFGIVVLFYHCTHYAIRGGHSAHSTNCGIFSIVVSNTASNAGWAGGAALLYDFILFSSWW